MSAVFRVVEDGAEQCFQTEHNLELLDAARLLAEAQEPELPDGPVM